MNGKGSKPRDQTPGPDGRTPNDRFRDNYDGIFELRRRAYDVAAKCLEVDMDRGDLPEDLSEEDESTMREFIRNEIVAELRRKGSRT